MWRWLRKRFAHFWRITRWGWFVIWELGWVTLFTNIDLIVGKYGSEQAKTYWERLTHPHWGWKVWLIGALVIAICFLIEGSFRTYSNLEGLLGKANKENEALKERFQNIHGPNLQIGFAPPDYGISPMIVINAAGGGWARSVTLRIPKDGSSFTSKTFNILRDDDTETAWQAGDQNRLTSAEIFTAGAGKFPAFVNCMDNDGRWFEYEFKPLENLRGYELVNRRCLERRP
jgi:hypothetical protein